MAGEAPTRKLAAILHADVVGYSRLMGEDEAGTHRVLRQYLDAISGLIDKHQGRVVNYSGDAVLADFDTVTEAVSAAVDIQDDLKDRHQESAIADDRRIQFRIGVHLGEVIVDGDDIYGDGVNVAARLESLAEPGGICISEAVRSAVGTKLPFAYAFMGEREVKNISEPVRAYRVDVDEADAPPSCPYPGMVPFGAVDAAHFYGRSEEVARMVQLLRRQRFMMVIGPSGSGKSSLVYAGLLPELEQSRYFTKDYWLIRTMRPGPNPTNVLSDVIGHQNKTSDFEPGTVDALLKANPPAERLLLLIDQFEEVFTQAERAEQARFITALQAFRAPENCALILTLRADFYPDLMTSYLWPVDASQRVEVAPLRGEALREAIQRPAADVGVRIEDALVNQLLADAADEPGALPLLQETMGLLWDDMEQRTLPMKAYEHLSSDAGHIDGGISGLAVAIAMKADTTLAELNERQQAIARRIFLRLIQFGEGRADTRRQQPVDTLRAANDAAGEFEQTLEHLTANRLLTRSGGDDHHPPAVDISHESLIGGWSRLQGWADEQREAEQIRRRLESKAVEWVRLGKGTGGLLDEAELPEAERWLVSVDAEDLGFDATLPKLVKASQHAITKAETARENARQHELRQAAALAEEQRERIAEQGRAAKRMRRSMVGLVAVLLVAIAAGVFGWKQSREAQKAEQEAMRLAEAESRARTQSESRRVEAEIARLESIAQLLLVQAPQQQSALFDERGALMALQAYHFGANGNRSLKAQVDSRLRQVIGKAYFSLILRQGSTESVVFNSDGTKLATSSINTGQVLLWDLTKPGARPVVLPGWPGAMTLDGSLAATRNFALALSPDGSMLLAANTDGGIAQWDLRNPQVPHVKLPKQKGGVWSAAYSANGHWLALGGKQDDVFTLWDLSKPEAEPRLISDPQPAPAGSGPSLEVVGGVPVAFSPDNSTLATGSLNGVIRLWQIEDMRIPITSLQGHEGGLLDLVFYGDGKHLASSGQDGTIRLWNIEEPAASPAVLETNAGPAASLDFDANSRTLASSGSGQGIWLWKVDEPELPPVHIPGGFYYEVAFSPDGKRMASGGNAGGHLRLWDMESSGRPQVLTGHQGNPLSLAFSPDMTLLVSGAGVGDENIRLWRWDDLGAPPTLLHGYGGEINSLNFSADGRRLVSASWDGNSIRIWDLDQPEPSSRALLVPETFEPWMALFAPNDEGVLATGMGGIYSWDLARSSTESKLLVQSEDWATEMALSSDGKTLAMLGFFADIFLKDLTRPDVPAAKVNGQQEQRAWSIDISPDGKRLASGDFATVRLWNLDNPDMSSVILGRHDAEVTRVRFSRDGKQVASTSMDHSVRLWNIDNLDELPIVLPGHEDQVWALAYSPDGKNLVTGSHDKKIRIWDLTHPLNNSTTQEIADKICEKVWRNMTLDEWHKFVGTEIPYERTCPNLPIHPSLFETAEKLAKDNDRVGAVSLLARAVELDPDLAFDPEEEVERLAEKVE